MLVSDEVSLSFLDKTELNIRRAIAYKLHQAKASVFDELES